MELTKNELIEKWKFRLALYAFVSMLLVLYAFNNLPPGFADSLMILFYILVSLILLPCFMGGIYYWFIGAKFCSSIDLNIGLSALMMAIFLCFMTDFPIAFFLDFASTIYGLSILLSCFVLIVRRNRKNLEEDKPISKWGIRLAVFTICVPLFALPVILFPHLLLKSFETRNLLMHLLLVLMIPSIVGGIFYLGVGAISKSSKLAGLGLSSPQLTLINFVALSWVFTFLFSNMG